MENIYGYEIQQILLNFKSEFESFEKPMIAHNTSDLMTYEEFVSNMQTTLRTNLLMFAVYSPAAMMHEFVYIERKNDQWFVCVEPNTDLCDIACDSMESITKTAAEAIRAYMNTYSDIYQRLQKSHYTSGNIESQFCSSRTTS
ncbi:hypothetical protein [Vibrio sp. 1CM23M]|uniref:hypothetical protein n=1 Tax=Vibrio sp. 1CM23M TaxID=2929164 RepID=UPI0020C13670|nr:hypothetical protein [Vibrio sp. 1CM23M]MCK8072413.1 hypothetical protein [Vibrio sp. 1CM23M]